MVHDIYIYLVVALVILFILQQFVHGKKILFLYAPCIMLILVLALRNTEIGVVDILRFKRYYNSISNLSLKDAIFFDDGKDIGYWLITYVFSSLGLSFQLFVSIVATFTIGVWGWYINKYSPNTILSCFILLGSGCYTFMFYGLRQVVAFSFIILCIDACYEKKIRKSLLFLTIATLCHWSSVAAFPILVVARRKFDETFLLFYIIILITMLLFSTQIGYIVTYLFREEYVDSYVSSGGVTGLAILYLTLLLWYFIVFKDSIRLSYKHSFFLHAFVLLCMIQICSAYAYSFTRLNFDYCLSVLTVTVPMSLSSKNIKKLISGDVASIVSFVLSGMVIALMIYLFIGFIYGNFLENYVFFWDDV